MTYDPAWDMPQLNWQQQGSFEQGSIPPTVEPTAGTQVWLGPVAREWLPWICGALDQLRNPSAWIVADDTHMYDTLRRVDTLLGLLCPGGSSTPEMIRFTSDCHLQTSTDGGTTWTTVPGWDANLHSCIVANLPPPLPPNPGGVAPDQYWCNISGFLATFLINESMNLIYSLVQQENNVDFIVTGILAGIGIIFPEIDGANIALTQFVQMVIAQTLSEINTVRTDTAFWSRVTCIIFNDGRADGHLTVSNVLSIGADLLTMGYPGHIWVPPAISAYWLKLGFTNLLSAQSTSAVDVVDCTACGNFCHQFDFTTGQHGWSILPGEGGTYGGASGFLSTVTSGHDELVVQFAIPSGLHVTHANVSFCTAGTGSIADDRKYVFDGGSTVIGISLAASACPTFIHSSTGAIALTPSTLWIVLRNSGSAGGIQLVNAQLSGTGADPFGTGPCTY